jgi:hypothetical protein
MNNRATEEFTCVRSRERQYLEIGQRTFRREATNNMKMTIFWKRNPNAAIRQRSTVSPYA